ncbi:hypothetical protein H1R20_g14453, partial [Candolleomyces eurysporus]
MNNAFVTLYAKENEKGTFKHSSAAAYCLNISTPLIDLPDRTHVTGTDDIDSYG